MINEYVLSPFTYIYVEKNKYIIGDIFNKKSEVKLESIEEILPNKDLISKGIFIKKSKINYIKETYFKKLEEKFYSNNIKIGYMETTSICPYKCKMCPKSSNDLERVTNEMHFDLFKKIVKQLNQKYITLHLFGDPFFDSDIYSKIGYLNDNNIMPSFSTNLTSLNKIDFDRLRRTNIDYLTISIDTTNSEEFSKIRGKVNNKFFENSFLSLEKLINISNESNCINHIILQMIDLNINSEQSELIEKIASKYDNCSFFKKQFILFPNMKDVELKSDNIIEGNNKVLIYQLLGVDLPFKCLKPWKQNELGVLSDGAIVPCCLSFNSTVKIGNLNNQTLNDIKNGESFKKFRYGIWNKGYVGEICTNCTQSKTKISNQLIPSDKLDFLIDYCISSWN